MEQEPKKKKTTKTSEIKKATVIKEAKQTKASSTKKETKPASKKTTTTKKKNETKTPTAKKANESKASTAKKLNEAKESTAKKANETKASTAKKVNESKASITKKVNETKVSTAKKANKTKEAITPKTIEQKEAIITENETTIEKLEEKTNKAMPKKSKNNKKYIDISIGRIIVIVLIIILIILSINLGIHTYKKSKATNLDDYEETNSENQITNLIHKNGYVLNKKNQLATNIINKITFKPNAVASIYSQGSFNAETITNDLKLRLGWAKTNDEEKLQVQEQGQEKVIVEKDLMQKNIKNIFGTQMECIAQSFNNTDVKEFSKYCQNSGIITFNNNVYQANLTQLEESEKIAPFIYQETQKILQYTNKIEVYVKTVFIDVRDGKYVLYKDFNGEFEEELLEITPEKLFEDISINQYTGEGTIALEENKALDSIRDKLNTYIYTLQKEEAKGEYYLSEFNKK